MTEFHRKLDEVITHLNRTRSEQIQRAQMQTIEKRTTGGPSIRGKIDRIVKISAEIMRGPPGAHRKAQGNFPYHMVGSINPNVNTRPSKVPRKRYKRWKR